MNLWPLPMCLSLARTVLVQGLHSVAVCSLPSLRSVMGRVFAQWLLEATTNHIRWIRFQSPYSNILLVQIQVFSRRWCQNLALCHPCGRPGWSSRPLFLHGPALPVCGCWESDPLNGPMEEWTKIKMLKASSRDSAMRSGTGTKDGRLLPTQVFLFVFCCRARLSLPGFCLIHCTLFCPDIESRSNSSQLIRTMPPPPPPTRYGCFVLGNWKLA